jgi:hypothetical protein
MLKRWTAGLILLPAIAGCTALTSPQGAFNAVPTGTCYQQYERWDNRFPEVQSDVKADLAAVSAAGSSRSEDKALGGTAMLYVNEKLINDTGALALDMQPGCMPHWWDYEHAQAAATVASVYPDYIVIPLRDGKLTEALKYKQQAIAALDKAASEIQTAMNDIAAFTAGGN